MNRVQYIAAASARALLTKCIIIESNSPLSLHTQNVLEVISANAVRQQTRRTAAGEKRAGVLGRIQGMARLRESVPFWNGLARIVGAGAKRLGVRGSYYLVAMASLAALSACGGGDGSAPQEIPAKPAIQQISIDAQGDSTMWSAITFPGGSFVQANPTAPQSLQTDLQTALGSGFSVHVTNSGVTSTTLCQRMSGTGGFTQTLSDYLKSSPAQYVLENFGMNDASAKVSSGETPTQFQQCLEQFVDVVRAAGKTPILEEPNPVSPSPVSPDFDNSTLSTFVAVIDAVAQEKNAPLIQQYAQIQSLSDWPSLLSDGVHPTQALYGIKASRESDAIYAILKK